MYLIRSVGGATSEIVASDDGCSASADRSWRVWQRTDEPLFVDEQAEVRRARQRIAGPELSGRRRSYAWRSDSMPSKSPTPNAAPASLTT